MLESHSLRFRFYEYTCMLQALTPIAYTRYPIFETKEKHNCLKDQSRALVSGGYEFQISQIPQFYFKDRTSQFLYNTNFLSSVCVSREPQDRRININSTMTPNRALSQKILLLDKVMNDQTEFQDINLNLQQKDLS